MTRRDIDEAEFRALVAEYPLYVVAERLEMNRRTVTLMAERYGLASAAAPPRGTAEEWTRIQALAGEGCTITHIAKQLGRSQEFVARRLNRLARPTDAPTPRRKRGTWPQPDTTIEAALKGGRYEDVAETLLRRECPAGRWPINGAALAAVGRFAATSFTRSSADLCTDA